MQEAEHTQPKQSAFTMLTQLKYVIAYETVQTTTALKLRSSIAKCNMN